MIEKPVERLSSELSEAVTPQRRDATTLTSIEQGLAEVLASVVRVEHVSVESDFFNDLGANSLVMAQFCARVRKRADLPSVSIKDVYQHPTIRSLAAALAEAAPAGVAATQVAATRTGDIEKGLAEVLASVVRVEHVSVESDFFNDLGANSLVMAQFCARVRKRADLPSVSIKDVYKHPTIRSLAAALAEEAPAPAPAPAVQEAPAPIEEVRPTSTFGYILTGVLQFLIYVGYTSITGFALNRGFYWVAAAGANWGAVYLRSALFGGGLFLGMCIFPILIKWALIGRWKAGEFPVWSLNYVRFWTVKTLVHANPMVFFVGTPLYVLYLRALGAHIGKGVTILSRSIPVCTDLLTIGPGTVICKDSTFQCYRVYAGRIQTGPVTLGRNVYIGEKTVLDINVSMGDETQLGHTSSLQSGQVVPDCQHWHGSPALPTHLNYLRVAPVNVGIMRRFISGLLILCIVCFVYMPALIISGYALFTLEPNLSRQLLPGVVRITRPGLYIDALVLSMAASLALLCIGLASVFVIPRLLHLAIKPGKVYPIYGFHYTLHRTIMAMTNIKFFYRLFGDSSYILDYLRGLGYKLSKAEQTGANFGSEMQHESPFLSSVGQGTMVCDGLSIVNADYSSSSFRLSQVSIGAYNFLGNNIAFPSGARTGDNVLLATKVMVPLEGEIRENVGLLGSPSFEIPRSVERDSRFEHLWKPDVRRKRLAAKNRYNIRTMGLVLFMEWLQIFLFSLFAIAAVNLDNVLGPLGFAIDMTLSIVVSTAYYILIERITTGFRPLRPQFCSIYDRYYWWHERLWKVPDAYLNMFNGTPFKNIVWRLLGVRVGKRVFDDGVYLTERTLTVIGDDCTLNVQSKIQCHSLEDGTFKSDYTRLGNGCTLGVGAFVHYGVTMGDGAVLAADSFLMKGEEIPAHAQWVGNPARALTNTPVSTVVQAVPEQSALPPVELPAVHPVLPQPQEDQGDRRKEADPIPALSAVSQGSLHEQEGRRDQLAEQVEQALAQPVALQAPAQERGYLVEQIELIATQPIPHLLPPHEQEGQQDQHTEHAETATTLPVAFQALSQEWAAQQKQRDDHAALLEETTLKLPVFRHTPRRGASGRVQRGGRNR
jgi:non-ribosomal peptide synthetase-like protein